jgi:drug/metabolite transporter (DMT)-like permease
VLQGVLAGLAAGALWGLVFVVPAWLPHWPPVDLAAGRLMAYGLMALGAMVAVRLVRGTPLICPTPRQALSALGLSVLGYWGYYTVLVLALSDAGAEVPTLVIGTIPLWVMVLGKPGHLRWSALVPGLALTASGLGLMTLSVQTPDMADAAPEFWRGVALAALAMVSWTVFALLNARWLRAHPQVSTTEWANWLGLATGLGALALWLAAGSPWPQMQAREGFGLFLMLCVGTGFGAAWLATVLWNVASRRLSASLCGQLIVSETLFALLYAFTLEGRWPTPAQALAALLFTLGILASIRAQR